jgi:hypothetical protein
MKRFFTPFRLASYLLVLFFLGHTGGGMLAQKSMGPESDAVFAAMKNVHFQFSGADATWYGFWFGFGLMASAFLLLSAVIAWQLDRVTPAAWPQVAVIAWAFCAAQAFNMVLSWKYFFAGPAVFAGLVTVLIAIGSVRKMRAA